MTKKPSKKIQERAQKFTCGEMLEKQKEEILKLIDKDYKGRDITIFELAEEINKL